ncbi:MAG TPA: hypothetical protein VK841_21435 [Polyangiaceae bacterium]|nr:hypothetical protein [Polyangiaceae bacterium]
MHPIEHAPVPLVQVAGPHPALTPRHEGHHAELQIDLRARDELPKLVVRQDAALFADLAHLRELHARDGVALDDLRAPPVIEHPKE